MTTARFGVCELPLRHITISLLLLISSSVSALSPLKLSNSLNCGSLSHRLKQIRSNAFVSPNPPAFAAARFCACPNILQRRISSRTLDDAPGRRRVNSRTATTMSGGVVNLLGQDVVSFLATSVVVVPLCKQLNISPVLGFLGAGLVSVHCSQLCKPSLRLRSPPPSVAQPPACAAAARSPRFRACGLLPAAAQSRRAEAAAIISRWRRRRRHRRRSGPTGWGCSRTCRTSTRSARSASSSCSSSR